MRFVLGIDAGATKTFALVADEQGRALGFGRGGPANHQVVGLASAVIEFRRASEEALAQADLSPPVDVAVFGLAGADLPVDFALLTRAVEELGLAKRAQVENDSMVALRAGARRGWGVVVICGTGFNAAGIGPDGRRCRLPGLGWISGDWGGGMDIAQEVIRLVSRAWDGRGQPTALTASVLQALGVSDAEALISRLYEGDWGEQRLLSLVPLVFAAAGAGDQVAQELLIRVGAEVGASANAIIRRLGLEETDVEVVLAGGVFKGKGPLLLDTVTQVVHRAAPQAVIRLCPFEPVVGAALLALDGLGVDTVEDVHAHLLATLPSNLKLSPAPTSSPGGATGGS